STAMTKGFIIGLAMPLVVLLIMVTLMPLLIGGPAPKVAGELAIVDPTGEVVPRLTEPWQPAAGAERPTAQSEQLEQAMDEAIGEGGAARPGGQMSEAMELALGQAPDITVTRLPPEADVEAAKEALWQPQAAD